MPLAGCKWRLGDGYVRWCGEDIIKLEVFVIYLPKAKSSEEKKKKEKQRVSLMYSQGESTIKDIPMPASRAASI